MKLMDRILVAVGFGDATERMMECAAKVGSSFGAEVVLMHVIPAREESRQGIDAARTAARERLDELGTRIADQGVRVGEPVVDSGLPHVRICAHAAKADVNLVVVGAGQSLDRDRTALGQVAQDVIRRARKTVWLVKPGNAPTEPRVLCPVDFLETSRTALQSATHIARHWSIGLQVLAVAPPPGGALVRLVSGNTDERDQRDIERTRASLDNLLQDFDFHGVQVQKTVASGKRHRSIVDVVQQSGTDLLVMGLVGWGPLGRLWGSPAQRVIHQVPCSILAIKRQGPFRVRLEADPGQAEQLFKEAEELLAEGLPGEAIKQFKNCLTVSPTYVAAWGGVALSHERLGQRDEAEEAWQQAWQLRERLWETQMEADIRNETGR